MYYIMLLRSGNEYSNIQNIESTCFSSIYFNYFKEKFNYLYEIIFYYIQTFNYIKKNN